MAHPSSDLINVLLALAEGRLEPAEWHGWWDENSAEVEKSVPRGWYLRLKPKGLGGVSINHVILESQLGACYVLDQLKVSYTRSRRYEVASQREIDSHLASLTARKTGNTEDKAALALAGRFRKLGALDPEGWARSELVEQIPQLARFVFLRELWKLVSPRDDIGALNRFSGPHDDGRGGALRRIKDRGVDMADVLVIVREAQADMVRQVVCLLDQLQNLGPDWQDIRWGLYELDSDFEPTRAMDGLHESVDDEDVRPRNV